MADPYSQIPLHSSAPLNPTPYGYDGPPLASRILYGDSSAVTKLMDGIFLGGIEAGQDLEFCASHKISSVINCSGSSDILSQYGLKYLSLRWLEGSHGPGSVMFDPQGRNIQRIFKFIEGCRARGEGILIHSMDGNSRAVGVMMAYLMRKFKWGMTKCIEYIRLKRPHIHPSPILLKQLARAAQYLNLNPNDQSTTFHQRWIQHPPGITTLETLLHNTFMNGHAIPVHAPGTDPVQLQQAMQRPHTAKKKKLVWIDETNTNSNTPQKRGSFRGRVDDDDDDALERETANRLMHKALGVHYTSSMMHSSYAPPQSQSTAAGNIIRPAGAHYGPRHTPPEVSKRPLLKMKHLQPREHFSWSLDVAALAMANAIANEQHQQQQQQQSQSHPHSSSSTSNGALSHSSTPASSVPSSGRPLSAKPPMTITPATSQLNGIKPPPASHATPNTNTPETTPTLSSTHTLSGSREPSSHALAAAAALAAHQQQQQQNAAANSRSAWTPERDYVRNHVDSRDQKEKDVTDATLNPAASATPTIAVGPSTSGPITSTAASSFTKSVPGKPVVPSYRPATATPINNATTSFTGAGSASSSSRGSFSAEDASSLAAIGSELSMGGGSGSNRSSFRSNAGGASTTGSGLLIGLTSNGSASRLEQAALVPASPTPAAVDRTPTPASPSAPPSSNGVGSFSSSGLASRPLRSSGSISGAGSASITPNGSVHDLAASLPASASSTATAPPSPYSFMSSPALTSSTLGSISSISAPNSSPSHRPSSATGATPVTPSLATSTPARPSTAGTAAPFTQTAPLKLANPGTAALLASNNTRPLTAAPTTIAPRLATLMQGATSNSSGVTSSVTGLYGSGGSYSSSSLTPSPQSDDLHSGVRSSASSFAASRSRGSLNSSSVGGAIGSNGTGVSVPAFLSATYAHTSNTNTNTSAAQPYTPQQPPYYRNNAASANAFASSGIAAPNASPSHSTSGVIQWWVQDPKGSSASASNSSDASQEKTNGSSGLSSAPASSGAYPTSISSQSMLMFQKSRMSGVGSMGGGGAIAAGKATPPPATAAAFQAFQQQQQQAGIMGIAAAQGMKQKGPAGSPPSPIAVKSAPGKVGSSSAAGFYSTSSGNWNGPSSFSSGLGGVSSSVSSPYSFLGSSGIGGMAGGSFGSHSNLGLSGAPGPAYINATQNGTKTNATTKSATVANTTTTTIGGAKRTSSLQPSPSAMNSATLGLSQIALSQASAAASVASSSNKKKLTSKRDGSSSQRPSSAASPFAGLQVHQNRIKTQTAAEALYGGGGRF